MRSKPVGYTSFNLFLFYHSVRLFVFVLSAFLIFSKSTVYAQHIADWKNEKHRPQFHFSPQKGWMNDPNGLIFHKGVYHMFYQYFPGGTTWGPCHWGHATSTDMLHWKHQEIALFPDSLGYIFSGSAVYDVKNTSGFGTENNPPLVAIYTSHNMKKEQEQHSMYQYQSLAYSQDDGKTWKKYEGNPVLNIKGSTDFRDPKVSWNEETGKWIMVLAVKDHTEFYSSQDMKTWTKESEFGKTIGAHGGVWECPDLFPLTYRGKTIWILLVSINPGGPNGGSSTQYFMGDFDGHQFKPFDEQIRWIDWGPDNYAGVTFFGIPHRTILMGWMSNWQYAQVVPTATWRSAMTIPRELSLKEVNGKLYLSSFPVEEFENLISGKKNINIHQQQVVSLESSKGVIEINGQKYQDFSIELSNQSNDKLIIGFEASTNKFFIDRSRSGKISFDNNFAVRHYVKRFSENQKISLKLIIDVTSVELFADDGLSVMTEIFFPDLDLNTIKFAGIKAEKTTIASIKSTL